MLKIATGKQMKEIDRTAIEEYGIPGLDLMEEAGKLLTNEIFREAEKTISREVVIVCGGGNNGGDGYVAARLLMERGICPQVFSTVKPETLTGDAKVNYERFRELGFNVTVIQGWGGLNTLENALLMADLVVDCILGTGISREVSGLVKEVVDAINLSGKKVIAADIPSGVGSDDGKIYGCAVNAEKTVTFQMMKLGMMIEPGKSCAGEVKVVDIGIPDEICEKKAGDYFQIGRDDGKKFLRKRSREMSKGDAGKVLIVAGSKGMAGAAVLAASGALRSGAGLVKVAAPWEITNVIQIGIPEATCLVLGEDGHNTLDQIMNEARNFDAVAVGPGLGRSPEKTELIEHIIKNIRKPLVLDADGINAIADNPAVLKEAKAPVILTPHPGEMGRLIGKSAKEVNQDRVRIAKSFSSEYNVTLILKGADSMIAVPEGRVYINGTGNPGMATAGSGDVLTGIVAAFLAFGKDPEMAAAVGAFVHGLAGDRKVKTIGEYGMLASDIAAAAAEAILLITEDPKREDSMEISVN